MKYKVGDKVKVHTKEWFDNNCAKNDLFDFYGGTSGLNSFVPEMQKLCGQIVTIKNMSSSAKSYLIQEDSGRWHWEDWMFEDMNNNTDTISNPNIVEDFAKLIGVELGEEFYDKEYGYRYKITSMYGVMFYNPNTKLWQVCAENTIFKMIKEGKFIKKWTPKDGDTVYFPSFQCSDLYDYTTYYSDDEYDKEMLKNGLYFRTREEATECAKKIVNYSQSGSFH